MKIIKKMRNSISSKQFFTSFSLGIINTSISIYLLITMGKFVIFFITMWAYYANSVYLFMVMLCDISYYWFSSEKLEELNYFFRRYYSIISMPFSYFVTLGFWSLVCFGNDVMTMKPTFWFTMLAIYLHGLNTLFVIIDLKVADHYKVNFSLNHIGIISCVFLAYSSVLLISRYVVGFNPYPFMNLVNFPMLALIGIVMFGILLLCYWFHIFLCKDSKEEVIPGEIEYHKLK